MRPTTNPEALRAVLYPFQEIGHRWLATQKTAMLGDEPGLGKSVQAIRAADLLGLERIFIVAPSSAIFNWRTEFRKFSLYDRRVQVVDSGAVRLDPLAQVVITTHGLLRNPALHYQVRQRRWDLVVADEAQVYKNESAAQTQAFYGPMCAREPGSIASLAERVWLLTGTPAKNHVGEMWTHLRALRPLSILAKNGTPQSYEAFIHEFCSVKRTRFGLKPFSNKPAMLPKLRALVGDFVLRRKMDTVMPEIPKTRFELTQVMADHVPTELRMLNDEFGDIVNDVLKAIEDGAEGEELLKQIGLITEGVPGGLARLRHLTGMLKVAPTMEILEEHFEAYPNKKVVVFAMHTTPIELLVSAADRNGWSPVTVTGSVTARNRQKAVERFQTDPKCKVFFGQIQACSTAITLTAATDVLFVEGSWTPSDNVQAARRVRRIGQKHPTRVRFLALVNSIDDAVMRVLARKVKNTRELFDA